MTFSKLFLFLLALLLFGSLAHYFFRGRERLVFADEKTPMDDEALRLLAAQFQGSVVFDSNRSGTFGIYVSDVTGKSLRTIADSDKHDMYPDVSPDGQWIVYVRSESAEKDPKGEIWLVQRDGTQARRLSNDGTFPTFSGDGKTVYFERGRAKVMAVSIDGSAEREVFPAALSSGAEFAKKQVVKPRVSLDGRSLVFTSDHGGRWTAWHVDLQTGIAQRIEKGCEPTPFAAGDKMAWVTKRNVLAKSAIGEFDLKTGKRRIIHDDGPPRGHEYFPTLAKNDQFLLYAASRANEHSHVTGNYQLYVKNLGDGKVTRLTFDTFTNRWPKYLPDIQNPG